MNATLLLAESEQESHFRLVDPFGGGFCIADKTKTKVFVYIRLKWLTILTKSSFTKITIN